MYEMCACLSRLNQLSNNNKNVRFSAILPPNSGYTTEMAFLISVHLPTEITPLSLMLLAPSVKCVKNLSTKTVAKTRCQSTHVNIRHWVQKKKSFVMIQTILFLVVLAQALQAVILKEM